MDEVGGKGLDWRMILVLDIVVFIVWFWLYGIAPSGIFTRVVRLMARLAGGLSAFFVINAFVGEVYSGLSESRFINSLASKYLIIYCIHQQIIYFTIYLLNGRVPPVIHAVINFGVSLVVSILIASCLKRIRYFCGGQRDVRH